MPSQQSITARQLTRAREAQFHRNGEPLQTTDAIREWVESVGLLPVYPLPQFQAPMATFAEAVLGRTEYNWVAPSRRSATVSEDDDEQTEAGDANDEDFDEFEAEDEEDDAEEDFASDDDEDSIDDEEDEASGEDEEASGEDEESDAKENEEETATSAAAEAAGEDQLEPPTAEGDEAMLAGDGNIPADPETMLSDDDEFAEDEGDEIAEEDRINAGGDPVPNDLREGSTTSEGAEEEPDTPPVNGFSPEERETVYRALARLIEDGTVVPLNLLGNSTGEPDYIVPASAFSFVYTLRGDKNWKNEPETTGPMRVSPLAVKVFALLKEKGAMAPHKLTTLLGQGITDSATLRALTELWAIQRVIPLPNADGEPAKWELITSKFLRPMKAGANAGQPTALSALLSLYLHQAIAATGDDMEIFLSPLAARSRVREVVHGLSATRQLDEIVVEGKTLLHIAGELPTLPAEDVSANEAAIRVPQRSRYEGDDRRADMEERRARYGDRSDARPGRGDRPAFQRGDRPSFGDRPRKPFGERRAGGEGDRERRPFQRREGGFAPREGGFAPRKGGFQPRNREGFAPRGDEGAPRDRNSFARPWDDERPRRTDGDGERRPFTPREDRGERRPFTPREGGERRPYTPRGDRGGFQPREGGERRGYVPRGDRPYANREGSGGFRPRTEGGDRPFNRRPFGDREQGGEDRGERRPFTPREGGERRPFAPREGGERRPFTPRGDREGGFAPRGGGFDRKPGYSDRKPGGFGGPRKPFGGDREGGERRPFTPREGGERRPFTPREDRGGFAPRGNREGGFAPRRPFAPREGGEGRPFPPREGGFNRGGGRPSFGGGNRPAFGGRPRFDREGGSGSDRREGGFGDRKPGGFGGDRKAGGFGDRKRFSGEPGEGRPNFQSGAHSAGPGGAKFGGSGFGRDRGGKGAPGKFGKPGFKPSFRGPGSGPARGGAPKRRPE